ncbi:MAG TPA: hypothetical protein VN026_09620 [Bacteroidia bacterium]|jgi:hypothetical protein|nr:hypothetical protein [Bacteroidia bacterium]
MKIESKCILILPEDKKIIDTPLASFWFDENILYSIAKSIPRSMENIKESIQIIKQHLPGKKVCMIADTSNVKYYSIEMRDELARSFLKEFRAVALVPCTRMGKIMGVLLLKRKKIFPVEVFHDLNEAKTWIKQYCNET